MQSLLVYWTQYPIPVAGGGCWEAIQPWAILDVDFKMIQAAGDNQERTLKRGCTHDYISKLISLYPSHRLTYTHRSTNKMISHCFATLCKQINTLFSSNKLPVHLFLLPAVWKQIKARNQGDSEPWQSESNGPNILAHAVVDKSAHYIQQTGVYEKHTRKMSK